MKGGNPFKLILNKYLLIFNINLMLVSQNFVANLEENSWRVYQKLTVSIMLHDATFEAFLL